MIDKTYMAASVFNTLCKVNACGTAHLWACNALETEQAKTPTDLWMLCHSVPMMAWLLKHPKVNTKRCEGLEKAIIAEFVEAYPGYSSLPDCTGFKDAMMVAYYNVDGLSNNIFCNIIRKHVALKWRRRNNALDIWFVPAMPQS